MGAALDTGKDEKKEVIPIRDAEKAAIDFEHGPPGQIEILKDGVRLHPQPTADPLDPLNWSWIKKHTILGIVMYL